MKKQIQQIQLTPTDHPKPTPGFRRKITLKSIPFTLLMVIYAFSIDIQAQSYLTNGLVAFYPFNGNANDASGNGNNATLNGSPQLISDRLGNPNAAYNLNGAGDYLTAPASSSLNIASDLTIALWIKPRLTGNNNYLTIVSYSDDTTDQYAFDFTPGNILQYTYYNSFYHDTHDSSNTAWPSNAWQHACMVVTPETQTVTFYRNGSQISAVAQSFSPGIPTAIIPTLYIGLNPGENYYLPAAIDNVRIFNRALSASEVLGLYNAELPLTLSAQLAGTNVVVSWPYPATGWTLQQCTNLTTGSWSPASGFSVSNDGTNNSITITSPTNSFLFFRLQSQ
jgi:hypothetical protein